MHVHTNCSVQYALQELPNVRQVTVTRKEVRGTYGHHSSVQRLLGYSWDVSFTNPGGDLHALKVGFVHFVQHAYFLQSIWPPLSRCCDLTVFLRVTRAVKLLKTETLAVQVGSAFNLTNTASNVQLGNASSVVSVATKQHGLVRPESAATVASFETSSNQTSSTLLSGASPIERAWVMVFDDDPALLADRLSVDSVAAVSALTYNDQNGSAFHRSASRVCRCCSAGVPFNTMWAPAVRI